MKDIPIDKRKDILENLIFSKMSKAGQTYRDLYDGLKAPIAHLSALGMDIPEGFRVCAKYTLISDLVEELKQVKSFSDNKKIKKILELCEVINKFKIDINNEYFRKILSDELYELVVKLQKAPSIAAAQEVLAFFEILEVMKVDVKIASSQDVFYDMFCANFEKFFEKLKETQKDLRRILLVLVDVANKLNINVSFYKDKIDILTGKI